MGDNLITKTTELAMHITASYLAKGDGVVDATCGNGHDTLALAYLVGPAGRVLAMDVQEEAIRATRARIEEAVAPAADCDATDSAKEAGCDAASSVNAQIAEVKVVQDSFTHLAEQWGFWQGKLLKHADPEDPARPTAVVFNLGYLPGGDKEVTTTVEVTLPAVRAAINLVKAGGIVTIVMYPGHAAGKEERDALLAFAEELPGGDYHVGHLNMINQSETAPEILWITRKEK